LSMYGNSSPVVLKNLSIICTVSTSGGSTKGSVPTEMEFESKPKCREIGDGGRET
jgi:hypothetical protein